MQPTLQNGKVVEREKPLETVIDFLGTTSSAKDEIAALFGGRTAFATPKPMKLIKEFVRAASEIDSIVLDFFAGSGTTGHAVMDLNKEDGGSRKFILITNNENKYECEIYEGDKKIQETEFKIEEKDGKTEIKFELEKDGKSDGVEYKIVRRSENKFDIKREINNKKSYILAEKLADGLFQRIFRTTLNISR